MGTAKRIGTKTHWWQGSGPCPEHPVTSLGGNMCPPEVITYCMCGNWRPALVVIGCDCIAGQERDCRTNFKVHVKVSEEVVDVEAEMREAMEDLAKRGSANAADAVDSRSLGAVSAVVNADPAPYGEELRKVAKEAMAVVLAGGMPTARNIVGNLWAEGKFKTKEYASRVSIVMKMKPGVFTDEELERLRDDQAKGAVIEVAEKTAASLPRFQGSVHRCPKCGRDEAHVSLWYPEDISIPESCFDCDPAKGADQKQPDPLLPGEAESPRRHPKGWDHRLGMPGIL